MAISQKFVLSTTLGVLRIIEWLEMQTFLLSFEDYFY